MTKRHEMVKGDKRSSNFSLDGLFVQLHKNKEYFILETWQMILGFSKTKEWEKTSFHLDICLPVKMNTIYAMNSLELLVRSPHLSDHFQPPN